MGGSWRETFAPGGQCGRGDAHRLGRGHEVRFVRAQEIEHREVGRRLADRRPQAVRIEARNGEETLRSHCVREDPGERVKGNP